MVYIFARMLNLLMEEKESMSDGTDRDYGHVLCERPRVFSKAENGAFPERQSKRTCLGERAYVAFGRACRLFDFHRVEDAVMFNEDVYLRTGLAPQTIMAGNCSDSSLTVVDAALSINFMPILYHMLVVLTNCHWAN